jgi:hypothetical protein
MSAAPYVQRRETARFMYDCVSVRPMRQDAVGSVHVTRSVASIISGPGIARPDKHGPCALIARGRGEGCCCHGDP